MNRFPLLASTAAVLVTLSGCVTHTAPITTTTTATSYASDLGDQTTVALDEIVVSLPLQGSSATYHNLHLVLGVIINPVVERTDPNYSSSNGYAYEAGNLVGRLGPRINATVSDAILERGNRHQNLADMSAIRKQAVSVAEGVLTEAMRNWKYAADYKVEVVVLNSYWTDSAVGRLPQTATVRW